MTMSLARPADGPAAARGAPVPGPLLFARYAFGPNRLGLCGPEDWRSLLEMAAAGNRGEEPEVDRGLRELAAGFDGALPYLQLIAGASGIEDVLDPRVVEAYWIGNALSDAVPPALLARSMDERFRRQVTAGTWRWLAGKPAAGARPTHGFHVLDVFPRVGTARGGSTTDALGLMDACRIRWGRVIEVVGDQLVVDVVPLQLQEHKLALGPEVRVSVQRWLDGTGFVDDVGPGDMVSLHWDWACEVLSRSRLRSLQWRTRHAMAIANQTI